MRRITALLCCFLMLIVQTASAESQKELGIELQKTDWTWTAGEVATFAGTLHPAHTDLNGAKLELTIQASPETDDSGKLVFTSCNGKRIKVRNQSETCSLENVENSDSIPFECSWILPEGSMFQKVTITATCISESGENLFSYGMTCVNDSWFEQGDQKIFHIPADLDQLVLILCVACAVVWTAAIIRNILLRHEEKRVQKGEKAHADL